MARRTMQGGDDRPVLAMTDVLPSSPVPLHEAANLTRIVIEVFGSAIDWRPTISEFAEVCERHLTQQERDCLFLYYQLHQPDALGLARPIDISNSLHIPAHQVPRIAARAVRLLTRHLFGLRYR